MQINFGYGPLPGRGTAPLRPPLRIRRFAAFGCPVAHSLAYHDALPLNHPLLHGRSALPGGQLPPSAPPTPPSPTAESTSDPTWWDAMSAYYDDPNFTYGTSFCDLLPGPYSRGPFPPLPLPPLNPRDADRPFLFPSADELRPPKWGRGRLCPRHPPPPADDPADYSPLHSDSPPLAAVEDEVPIVVGPPVQTAYLAAYGLLSPYRAQRPARPSSSTCPYQPTVATDLSLPRVPDRCVDRHPDDLRGTDLIFASVPLASPSPALPVSAPTSTSMPPWCPASSSSDTWPPLRPASRVVINLCDSD